MPCEKATYLTAALNEPAAHILYGVPAGVTYEVVTEMLENHYGDYHLQAAFHSELKRRTHLVKESLQEFDTDIDHLAHHAHVELP
jgi:hypothetical protein